MKKQKHQRLRSRFLSLFCIVFAATLCGSIALAVQSPGARGRGVPQVNEIDQAEGKLRIERLRGQRLSGDFGFRFELKHMPKHGKSVRYGGTLWGSWNVRGPVMRLYLKVSESEMVRLLVQSGPVPEAWLFGSDGERQQLQGDELYKPLIEGMRYSAFDLMMPFIYWDNYTYAGSKRVRGQPGHTFVMYPPDYSPSSIGQVIMVLHAGYNALIKAEIYDKIGNKMRTLNILSFKKISKEWIIKSADLLDEETHDKTRFHVLKAKIGLGLNPDFFTPSWTGSYPLIDELE